MAGIAGTFLGLIIGGVLGPIDRRLVFLVGITYGFRPYGTHTMGWTNPWVPGSLVGGAVVLGVFTVPERRVAAPMLELSLFCILAFTAGNLASLLSAIGRGGPMSP